MPQLAGTTVEASIVQMAQFTEENLPHQFIPARPGGFWLVVSKPITANESVQWGIDKDLRAVRVPLLPYLTIFDDAASNLFQLQLGMIAGMQLPRQYAGRVQGVHMVCGDTVDPVEYAGKQCVRQFIGMAAWVKGGAT